MQSANFEIPPQTRICRRERYHHDQSAPGSLALHRDEHRKTVSLLRELPKITEPIVTKVKSGLAKARTRIQPPSHRGRSRHREISRVSPISASPSRPPQCCHRPLVRHLLHRQKCPLDPKGLSQDAPAQHLGLAHPHRCPQSRGAQSPDATGPSRNWGSRRRCSGCVQQR